MKLVISDGAKILLNLEDRKIDLPETDKDCTTSMMLLSETLVLLANTCDANSIESAASKISDIIRRNMIARMHVLLADGEIQQ